MTRFREQSVFFTSLTCILGFHSRDTGHGNGCYPPSLCPSSVNNLEAKRRECDSSRWSTVL